MTVFFCNGVLVESWFIAFLCSSVVMKVRMRHEAKLWPSLPSIVQVYVDGLRASGGVLGHDA